MAVLVSDSFNRADNTTTLGSTDSYAGGTSQAWQVVSGGTYGISSNQAYSSVTVNDKPAYVETGASDVKVSIDIISSSGIYTTGMTFRFQDSNNYFRVYATTGVIKIDRRLSGTYTTILNQTMTGMSYPYTLTIEGNGSTINAYANSVLKATVTDTNFQTATKHGLYLSNTAQRLDNFKVEDFNTGGTTPTTQDGTASLIGYGAVSTTGNILKQGSSSLIGTGLLTANGSVVSAVNILDGSVALIGTGSLTASGIKIQNALANLIGIGTLTTSGLSIRNSQASLIGQGLVTANGTLIPGVHILDGSAVLLGNGILTANADVSHIVVIMDGTFKAIGYGTLGAYGELVPQKRPPIIGSIVIKGGMSTAIKLKGNLNNTIRLKGGI